MRGGANRGGIPKMPLPQYLSMIESLRSLKRFALVNQEVHNGYVYFPDVAAINRLKELLRHESHGEKPSEMTIQGGKKVSDKRFSVNVFENADMLASVKGPDGAGWYTSRCPVCEHFGGDTDHNHFRFREDGPFKCFKGCEGWKVIEWFKAMLADREPVFERGKVATPSEIEDYFKEDSQCFLVLA